MYSNLPEDQIHEVFIPRCRSNGRYEEIQCQDNLGVCWCVNQVTGAELPGTRGRGIPDCSQQTQDRWSMCAPGSRVHQCSRWMCDKYRPLLGRDYTCQVDPCNGCSVEFFDLGGLRVNIGDIKQEIKLGKSRCEQRAMEDLQMRYTMYITHQGHVQMLYHRESCKLAENTDECLAKLDMNMEEQKMKKMKFDPCEKNKVKTEWDWLAGGYVHQCGVPGEPDTSFYGYRYRQCSADYCWCVSEQGIPFNNTLTPSDRCLVCDAAGRVEKGSSEILECDHKVVPDLRFLDDCKGRMCTTEDGTLAYCRPDPCNRYKQVFINADGVEVKCKEQRNVDPTVCDQQRKTGSCEDIQPRWYHDQKQCLKFEYTGCGGNDNRFLSRQACMDQCDATSGVTFPDTCNPAQSCPDVCSGATCAKFPEAVCMVDRCTCQAWFMNPANGAKVTCDRVSGLCDRVNAYHLGRSWSSMQGEFHPRHIQQCQVGGDRFTSTQCEGDTCHCVDDRGVLYEAERGEGDKCNPVRIVAFLGHMEFDKADFREHFMDDPNTGGYEFKEALKDALSYYSDLPREYFKINKAWSGSINVEYEVDMYRNDSYIDDYVLSKVERLQRTINSGGFYLDFKNRTYQAALLGGDVYIRQEPDITPVTVPDEGHARGLAAIIALAVIAGIIILAIIIGACIYSHTNCCKKRKRETIKRYADGMHMSQHVQHHEKVQKRYAYDENYTKEKTLVVDFDEEEEARLRGYRHHGMQAHADAIATNGYVHSKVSKQDSSCSYTEHPELGEVPTITAEVPRVYPDSRGYYHAGRDQGYRVQDVTTLQSSTDPNMNQGYTVTTHTGTGARTIGNSVFPTHDEIFVEDDGNIHSIHTWVDRSQQSRL